jgi:hypothetical protein
LSAGEFITEPYETAWAREARWFIHVGHPAAGTVLRASSEISPDGLTWCALPGSDLSVRGDELATTECHAFGGWLRLRCTVEGAGELGAVRMYLVLKG